MIDALMMVMMITVMRLYKTTSLQSCVQATFVLVDLPFKNMDTPQNTDPYELILIN